MRKRTRWLAAAALTLGIGLLATAGTGCAADDEDKAIGEAIRKLAKAIDAKDDDTAKKMAAELSKKDLEGIMAQFKLRKKGGLGFGKTAGGDSADGIEAKLNNLAKRPLSAADLAKQADDIAQLGLDSAAIAEASASKGPEKKMGEKDPKKWKQWNDDMNKSGLELANVAKQKGADPKQIKAAATKLNNSCTECHGVFRDS